MTIIIFIEGGYCGLSTGNQHHLETRPQTMIILMNLVSFCPEKELLNRSMHSNCDILVLLTFIVGYLSVIKRVKECTPQSYRRCLAREYIIDLLMCPHKLSLITQLVCSLVNNNHISSIARFYYHYILFFINRVSVFYFFDSLDCCDWFKYIHVIQID